MPAIHPHWAQAAEPHRKGSMLFAGATNDSVQIEMDRCETGECKGTCTDPWEEKDGQCYLWSKEKLFWGAAEEKCRSLGGHLASAGWHNLWDFRVA